MDYGEEGSFDQLFSSLTPEMTRDTWIEAAVGGNTVSGGTSGGNTPFEDLVTSGDIQYFTNDESPDIFMGTDEDIDRAVQKMFERPAKKVDNGDVELPLRTPSPPGMVYTQMTNMSSQSLQPPIAEEYTQNLRVPSTPLGCTSMTPYRPPQQTFPNTQPFPSSAMISGCNVGYTTTTFSPVPIPHNGEAPPSFGFYAPLPMPNDTIANSSSFSGSLSANANGLFAHSTRTTTVTTTARPNVATDVTTVNGEKLTPSATPRTLTGRTMSFSGRSATTPFYQPTIRKMKEIRPPKGSIEERSPMITALLKSQSQLFSQKNVPKPLIFAIKKQPKQIKKAAKQGKGVVKTGAPLPSRSISAGNPPLPDPTVITLDGASDQEELIEEEDPPLLTAQNNKGTAARNPSVLVFPNMRDFTLLGTKNSHQPRPQLCIQSRTIIGRVLAYNTEVRRRMGSGYVGPWLSPVKLTSYMTGISTSLVKQCEEFGKIRLVSCQAPEGKKPVPRNTVVIGPATPQKNKPVNQVVPPVRAIAPPSRFPIRPPFITNHSSVFSPVRPPMLMGQKLEFDWSSLYNGKPTPDKLMSRKRTQTVCGLLREEPVEKKARLPGELPKTVSPEDEAILRILRENGFDVSGPGQSEDSEIRGLVDELLDAVCYEEERMNEAIQMEDESLAEECENAAIPPKRITRFSNATPLRIPVRGRNKPFVPTIAEEPFMFRGKMHRDRRDANYNFRPRECIAKKRFTY